MDRLAWVADRGGCGQHDATGGAPSATPRQAEPQGATPEPASGSDEVTLHRIANPSKDALAITVDVVEAGKSTHPNILVIMGDDIGYDNISAHNQGMMGGICP